MVRLDRVSRTGARRHRSSGWPQSGSGGQPNRGTWRSTHRWKRRPTAGSRRGLRRRHRSGEQLHRFDHRRSVRDRGRARRGPVVHQHDNNSIGRITTAGVVTNYTGPGIDDPWGSRPGPTGPCGSPTSATTRSVGSPPPGWSPTTPTPASPAHGITAGPDGALWFTNDGNNSIGRITTAGVVTNYTDPSITGPRRSRPGPTGPCGSPTPATTRSGASPPPGWSPTTPDRASLARRDHGRARRGPVVHQPRQQLDRADHHRRGGHQLHQPGIDQPDGITAGPDGALWFTNDANNSIGRITTAGVVTNYTGTGIDAHGITAGPDGALWFTNTATTRSGGSPR